MGLAHDINTAKGYIPATPNKVYETGSGFAPYLWFDDVAVDGTAVAFAQAPIGSIYGYKASESAEPIYYVKMAANSVTLDWMILNAYGMGAVSRIKKIPVTTLTNAEIDTGWDLPAKSIVRRVWVDVKTAEATGATKTIDVGLLSTESGGDADGFLDGVSTAAIAVVTGSFTYTDGTSQNYVSAKTWGVLLYNGLVGADGADTAGTVNMRDHIAGSVTAKSVTYTLGAAATELVADIYIEYFQLGL